MVLFVAFVAITILSSTNAFVIPSSSSTTPTTRISTFTTSSSSFKRNINDGCNHHIHNNNHAAQLRLFNDADHHYSSSQSQSQLDASTTTAPSASSSLTLSSDQKSVLSVGIWCLLDVVFRRIFQRLDIASKFPSSLGGCGVMLIILLLWRTSSSASSASTPMSMSTNENKMSLLHRILSPGAGLLAKWLPVFFVPSLVTLPLVGGVESLGGSTEVRK
ncbi:MAG: hypothetical protein ACI90V_009778 [Bacillariaceae sp.]|jgi:hypothetical protein